MTTLPVSVVIPTFDRGALLARAVRSALNSCCKDDEIIVVDDGSTDETEQVLAEYRNRLIYVKIPHSGAGKARNVGIDEATKPLIAFLDSDDEWMPGSLQMRRALMQARRDLVFCFSNFVVRTGTEDLHRYLDRWHNVPLRWDKILASGVPFSSIAPLMDGEPDPLVHIGDLYAAQLVGEYVLTSTVVVNRERAGKMLRFAEDLPTFEDLFCWVELARSGPAAYIDCEMAWQYAHAGFRISRAADGLTRLDARLHIVERTWARDSSFLARSGVRYRQVLQEMHRARTRMLLARGRTNEARTSIREDSNPPRVHSLLVHVPGFLIRFLLALRRAVRGCLRSSA